MNGILVRDCNRRYFSLNDLQRKILGKAEKHQTGFFLLLNMKDSSVGTWDTVDPGRTQLPPKGYWLDSPSD